MLLNDGTYKYTTSKETDTDINGKLRTVLGECLTSADYAMNMVVLKTITGAAQAVAFALESVVNEEIVGSIAGDDTAFLAMKDCESAKNLCEEIRKML